MKVKKLSILFLIMILGGLNAQAQKKKDCIQKSSDRKDYKSQADCNSPVEVRTRFYIKNCNIMTMNRRKFTKEDKLAILKEATSKGVTTTLEKHGIYPATYYSWKKKFETMGEEGFRHGITPAQLKEMKKLRKENGLLKKLLAEKDLEGHLKDELLKKKYALAQKGG